MNFPQINRNISRKYIELVVKVFLILGLMVLFFSAIVKAREHGQNVRIFSSQSNDQQSLNRAVSYLSQKDESRAKEQLQSALAINPGNVHAAEVLSKLSTGDKSAVLAEIERIKRVTGSRPDYWAAWVRLSYLYDEIGEVDLAKEAKQQADSFAF